MATKLEGENVPEIQSLTLRVNALNQSVDWWNTAMVWALVFAALAAVAVVVTTRVPLMRAKELGDVQAELIQAKDRQLTLDLKDKDSKIAQALKDSADANRTAESERLARVKIESKVAWRRLTQEQPDEMGRNIARRFSRIGVSLWFPAGDSEAAFFAGDIARTMIGTKSLVVQPLPASL